MAKSNACFPAMKVQLTYFKPESGKYYTDGFYDSNAQYLFQIIDEVKGLMKQNIPPGLMKGHHNFDVLIDIPGGTGGIHLLTNDKLYS